MTPLPAPLSHSETRGQDWHLALLDSMQATVRRHRYVVGHTPIEALQSTDYLRATRIALLQIESSLKEMQKTVDFEGDWVQQEFRIVSRDLACLRNRINVIAARARRQPYYYDDGKVNIPCLDRKGSAPFASFGADFDTAFQNIPLHIVHQVPDEILGSGSQGQVYKVTSSHGPVVFKIYMTHAGVIQGQNFFPIRLRPGNSPCDNKHAAFYDPAYIGEVSDQKMIDSFKDAVSQVRARNSLRSSKHYPKCQGLVYIQELKLWGVVYDFVEGEHLPTCFESIQDALYVMKSLAKGLKTLDKQGYPYIDLQTDNILLLLDGTAVLFDDIAKGKPTSDPGLSIESRKKFGMLLCQVLPSSLPPHPKHNTDLPPIYKLEDEFGPTLGRLINDCWSDKSMEEVSWDHILEVLDSRLTFSVSAGSGFGRHMTM